MHEARNLTIPCLSRPPTTLRDSALISTAMTFSSSRIAVIILMRTHDSLFSFVSRGSPFKI